MMSKLEIRMQNNELEARVIELEAQLQGAQAERDHFGKQNLEWANLAQEHEGRAAELESKLDATEHELAEAEDELKATRIAQAAAEGDLAELQAYITEQQKQQGLERYDDWYKRLHPVPGGEPDLHVACLPIRIIA